MFNINNKMKKNVSLYNQVLDTLILIFTLLILLIYVIGYTGFRNITENLIADELNTIIEYSDSYLGDGDWNVKNGMLYKGNVFIGNSKSESVYYLPCKTNENEITGGIYMLTNDKTSSFRRVAVSQGNESKDVFNDYLPEDIANSLLSSGRYLGEMKISDVNNFCLYKTIKDCDREIIGAIGLKYNISSMQAMIMNHIIFIIFIIVIALFISGYFMMTVIKQIILDIDKTTQYIQNYKTEILDLELDSTVMSPIGDSVNELRRTSVELEKKRQLAETDELTQLKNRIALDSWVDANYADIVDKHRPVMVEIIDVDYFKEFNDNYGHPAGDVCLQEVASVLQFVAAKYDCDAYRMGGDEFMIIKVGGSSKDIELIQSTLKDIISCKAITHEFSKVSDHVTLSQGAFYSTPDSYTGFHKLYSVADTVLYEVKKNGKNGYNHKVG